MNAGGTADGPVDEIRTSLAGPAVVRMLLGEGPHAIVGRLVDCLASGSYLMLQDGTVVSQENADALEDYNESGAVPYRLRTPEQIANFFEGLDLVEPGVVPIQIWRPDVTPTDPKDHVNTFGGIGLKR